MYVELIVPDADDEPAVQHAMRVIDMLRHHGIDVGTFVLAPETIWPD